MSSPMRIVSPTLRVSVSTSTPPWVRGGWPSLACPTSGRWSEWSRLHDVTAAPDGYRQWLTTQWPPDRMVAVQQDDLPGPGRPRMHDHRSTQVRRGGRDVPVRNGQDAVQLRLVAVLQSQLVA